MFIMFIPRIYCWEILLRVPPSPSPALPADSPQGDGSLRDDPEPYILETKPQRGRSREEIARRTSWARAQRTAELWAAAARSSPPPPPRTIASRLRRRAEFRSGARRPQRKRARRLLQGSFPPPTRKRKFSDLRPSSEVLPVAKPPGAERALTTHCGRGARTTHPPF